MKTTHTPGPWGTIITEEGFTIYHEDSVGNGDHIMAIPGDPESQANARLIAAAPDLLATVRDLVATLEKLCKEPDITVRQACVQAQNLGGTSLYAARAAIAKAEGAL